MWGEKKVITWQIAIKMNTIHLAVQNLSDPEVMLLQSTHLERVRNAVRTRGQPPKVGRRSQPARLRQNPDLTSLTLAMRERGSS